jgi:hypothetical protein
VLNKLVYIAYDLLVNAFKSSKQVDDANVFENKNNNNSNNNSEEEGEELMVVDDDDKIIDVNKLEQYFEHLRNVNTRTFRSNKNIAEEDEEIEVVVHNVNEKNGNIVTIALLHIEIVLEVLENTKFHQKLVKVIDNSNTVNNASATSSSTNDDEVYSEKNAIQTQFLEIVDVVLHLLAFATNIEQGFYSKKNKQNNNKKNIKNNDKNDDEDNLIIHLDANPLKISFKTIGENVSNWCYDALESIQKLVEIPSFIAILQELMHHKKLQVRQRALLILSQKLNYLQNSKSKKNEIEVSIVYIFCVLLY